MNESVSMPRAEQSAEEEKKDLPQMQTLQSKYRPKCLVGTGPVPDQKTVRGKFALPPSGSVEILSMQYIVKYSGKDKALQVQCHPDECITSTLSWASGSNTISSSRMRR